MFNELVDDLQGLNETKNVQTLKSDSHVGSVHLNVMINYYNPLCLYSIHSIIDFVYKDLLMPGSM